MPKGSPELTEKRKNEIVDACEQAYRAQGFYGVTIKEIGERISLTRPAIYNYFETKEEILLALLCREYQAWIADVESLIPGAAELDRQEFADRMAGTLAERTTLLRILNMNLYEIEQNSRVERLVEFKRLYLRSIDALQQAASAYRPETTKAELVEFAETFSAYLFGVYPFCFHTDKQLEAMKIAGVSLAEPSVREMLVRCLSRILPGPSRSGDSRYRAR